MKYLCLGHLDSEKTNARPKSEIEAAMAESWPHLEEPYRIGRVSLDAGLGPETRCLQQVNGEVKVTDGPFTESKELLGSVSLVEAPDMEGAIRVASLHPCTRVAAGEQLGWRFEIRPIHYFENRDHKLIRRPRRRRRPTQAARHRLPLPVLYRCQARTREFAYFHLAPRVQPSANSTGQVRIPGVRHLLLRKPQTIHGYYARRDAASASVDPSPA